jgi:hypothetical protein
VATITTRWPLAVIVLGIAFAGLVGRADLVFGLSGTELTAFLYQRDHSRSGKKYLFLPLCRFPGLPLIIEDFPASKYLVIQIGCLFGHRSPVMLAKVWGDKAFSIFVPIKKRF